MTATKEIPVNFLYGIKPLQWGKGRPGGDIYHAHTSRGMAYIQEPREPENRWILCFPELDGGMFRSFHDSLEKAQEYAQGEHDLAFLQWLQRTDHLGRQIAIIAPLDASITSNQIIDVARAAFRALAQNVRNRCNVTATDESFLNLLLAAGLK